MASPSPATTDRAGGDAFRRRLGWLSALPLAVLTLDQLLKAVVISWIGPDASLHRWEVAGRLVAFEYVENRGAAFGILPGRTSLLIVVALLITLGALALMFREARHHPIGAAGIGLVVGGALGNVMDRIRLGYVVDFIAVGIWPKFNIADTMITIGIALLLWSGMREGQHSASGQTAANPTRPRHEERGTAL
jgi:signal peptidase II